MLSPIIQWNRPHLAFDNNGLVCYYYPIKTSYCEAVKHGIEYNWSDVDEKIHYYPDFQGTKETSNTNIVNLSDDKLKKSVVSPCFCDESEDFIKSLSIKQNKIKKHHRNHRHKQRTSKKKLSKELFQHRKNTDNKDLCMYENELTGRYDLGYCYFDEMDLYDSYYLR